MIRNPLDQFTLSARQTPASPEQEQKDEPMPAAPRSKRTRDKVKAHRERLRRQGLRPIQVWVPDVRSPAFQAEAHRQSLAVARGAQERKDQDFIDSVSELGAG